MNTELTTDWLAVIEAKRNEASGGPYAGQWGGYWQQDLLEPGEEPGLPVGILSTTFCQERVTPYMAENGIDPEESVEHELVALLAWHEDGEELPRFAENIEYICELHNRFPLIASELRQLRAKVRQLTEQLTPGSPTERAPTQWAYEQASAAVEKHRQRADAAEAKLREIKVTPITTPDTSTPVSRSQIIGTIHCISVNRPNEPQALRWYGTSAVCGASGNAHMTQAQAEQDVQDWANGKPVGYVQHAVVPLSPIARYAPMVAAGVAADRRRARRPPYALAGLALLSLTLWFVGRIRS
jgi:hypothetical protein